jgi:hypothetical protein
MARPHFSREYGNLRNLKFYKSYFFNEKVSYHHIVLLKIRQWNSENFRVPDPTKKPEKIQILNPIFDLKTVNSRFLINF